MLRGTFIVKFNKRHSKCTATGINIQRSIAYKHITNQAIIEFYCSPVSYLLAYIYQVELELDIKNKFELQDIEWFSDQQPTNHSIDQ